MSDAGSPRFDGSALKQLPYIDSIGPPPQATDLGRPAGSGRLARPDRPGKSIGPRGLIGPEGPIGYWVWGENDLGLRIRLYTAFFRLLQALRPCVTLWVMTDLSYLYVHDLAWLF